MYPSTNIFVPQPMETLATNQNAFPQGYSNQATLRSSAPHMQQQGGSFNQQPGQLLFDDMGVANLAQGPLGQMGLTYGSRWIQSSSSYVEAKYNKSFSVLKYYFNVNNSYVINKISLLLFPFRHKYWKRRIQRQPEGDVYLPPRDDINAPDLYIPLMAFVSFVLLIGYAMGTAVRFTPEVLGMTATKGLITLAFEVILIKAGFYLLNSLTVPWFDVVAYCGYKYVGIVLTLIGGFLGPYVYYALVITTGLFNAIFMVKSLKLVFPEGGGFGSPSTQKRNYFLFAIAILQLFLIYYLTYDVTAVHAFWKQSAKAPPTFAVPQGVAVLNDVDNS